MARHCSILFCCLLATLYGRAQADSLDNERLAKMVSLSEVVVRSDMNVARFMDQVKKDTSFYKAFRNLRVLEFTAWNDIRIRDKKGNIKASLVSKTRQLRQHGCRKMQVLEQKASGDFYEGDSGYRYMTAELYAGLFFTKDSVCGETNVVKGKDFSPRGKSGMARHKDQLKMLLFNPGKKIPGIPFIGDRIDIFDPERAALYDFKIDLQDLEGRSCYVFTVKTKEDLNPFLRDQVVIDNMVTWFDTRTMQVMARSYDMSYDAGVYDFDVHIEVEMTRFGDLVVPRLLRYIGNWDVVLKKRERGVFTATLFDFGPG